MNIEIAREEDGRWIAEVPEIPGALAYGESREVAMRSAKALALRVLADRLEHGEPVPAIAELFQDSQHLLSEPVEQFQQQLNAIPFFEADARKEFCLRHLDTIATGKSPLIQSGDRSQQLRLTAHIRCSLAHAAFHQRWSLRKKGVSEARQLLKQALEEASASGDSDAIYEVLSTHGYLESSELNTHAAIELFQRAAFYIDNQKFNRICQVVQSLALYWSEWPETLQVAEAMWDWLALIDNDPMWASSSKYRAIIQHVGPEEVEEIAYRTTPATCAEYELCIAARRALGHYKRAKVTAAKALKLAEANQDKLWIRRFASYAAEDQYTPPLKPNANTLTPDASHSNDSA